MRYQQQAGRAGPPLMPSYPVDTRLVLTGPAGPAVLDVTKVTLEGLPAGDGPSKSGGTWSACVIEAVLDEPEHAVLQDHGYFGDTPQARLDVADGRLATGRPVHLRLALTEEALALLPPPADGAEAVLAALGGPAPSSATALADQASWRALEVWQESPTGLPGGSVMKVGYRTRWSAPVDDIDAARRLGPVHALVVETFLAAGLPIDYHHDERRFELVLVVGDEEYPCSVEADEDEPAVGVVVDIAGQPAVTSTPGTGEQAIDSSLLVGDIVVEGGRLRYRAHLGVQPEALAPSLVTEMLRAGVSTAHEVRTGLGGP